MTDFERMGAQFEINDNGDEAVIKGAGPVATVGNYQACLLYTSRDMYSKQD